MCAVCKDYIKGNLTPIEAYRNLAEMAEVLEPGHFEKVEQMIAEDMRPDPFEMD